MLTSEQRALAANPESLKLARELARRAKRTAPKWLTPDIESAAFFGLVLAARTYRPEAGVKFTSYAYRRIRGEILEAKRQSICSGFRRNGEAAPRRVGNVARIARDSSVGWELESEDAVRRTIAGISTARGRLWASAYFLEAGSKMKLIGQRHGVSEAMVSKVISDSLQELQGD